MTMKRKYDPAADLAYRSCNLASLMYILGIAREDFEKTTIDDAINTIRDRYVYKHDISTNIASPEYIKKQSIVLSRNFRRAWFDVQVAAYEVEHMKCSCYYVQTERVLGGQEKVVCDVCTEAGRSHE
jgi:hypothetical protein